MQPNAYQERVLRETRMFLDSLAKHQAAGEKYPSLAAWDECRTLFDLHGQYRSRRNGLGNDLPTVCIKVPTGGGKTLLASLILGQIHQTILRSRSGTGLVLWVVPSDQIYKDTLKAFRDRRHAYRESLEFGLSRRVEVWEKHEIHRITPNQLRTGLNLLVLKLASTNREDREQLKFFRDSGGNVVLHFPREDDFEAQRARKKRIPNLEAIADEPEPGPCLLKTSIGNLVRLCEPAVILDEGHKATSDLARRTIEGFNASIVVELSATPPQEANTLIRVSGEELLREQMIKLPINIATSNQKSWKDCLTQARDRRKVLADLARKDLKRSGRLLRPIVLVQVERTGRDQRDAGFIHSEDAKEHLMQHLGVPEKAIAIKTSETDDIEGIELLDEGCPIEWIITKAALQEGWDCPFAYVLVSLTNLASQRSMTQLVGRILRQPFAERTPVDDLNQSYVYCLRKKASEIASEVKAALESEGYEGDAASVIDTSGEGGKPSEAKRTRMRKEFMDFYREFEGKVYLPRFCVRNGKGYEPLDYFAHLIRRVEIRDFKYADADWDLGAALGEGKDSYYRMSLGTGLEEMDVRGAATSESDEGAREWIACNLGFDHFSQKQLRAVVSSTIDRAMATTKELKGRLGLVKFSLRDRISGFIERETDRLTHAAFEKLFQEKRLQFYLECVEGRFEIPPEIQVRSAPRLIHDDHEPIQRSLFDFVPNDLNTYERAVALCLDRRPEVLWWYRNLVGAEHFAIQGYRRNKIYPDFVVQEGRKSKPIASVLVLESKGKHLKGNEDTNYKRTVAGYFEKVGKRVPWQKLAKDFDDNTFRFQILDEGEYGDKDWHDDLIRMLEARAV